MPVRTLIAASCLVVACGVLLFAFGPHVDGQEDGEATEDAKVVLVESDENLLSGEIWGKWKVNTEFTKFVAGESDEDFGTIEFTKDEKSTTRMERALLKLVEELEDRGKENDTELVRAAKSVYATGKLNLVRGEIEMDAEFALIAMFGEPLLLIQAGTPSVPNWESSRVSFVRDPNGDNDLLFIGGDHKNETFTAMQRDSVE